MGSDYTLLIGDPSYSSWSLRGWLAFSLGNIPVNLRITRFYQPGFAKDLEPFYPAKTVPAVLCSDGSVWTDSLAIIEELATRHPQSGLLPEDPAQRATARSLMAEMHSGFVALRSECPMNTRTAYAEPTVSAAVKEDLARLELLLSHRKGHGCLTHIVPLMPILRRLRRALRVTACLSLNRHKPMLMLICIQFISASFARSA